jgi:hypothetical protein
VIRVWKDGFVKCERRRGKRSLQLSKIIPLRHSEECSPRITAAQAFPPVQCSAHRGPKELRERPRNANR